MNTKDFKKKVMAWVIADKDRLSAKKPDLTNDEEREFLMLEDMQRFVKRMANEEQTGTAPDNELVLGWIHNRIEEMIVPDKSDRYGIRLGCLDETEQGQLLLLFGLENLLMKPEMY